MEMCEGNWSSAIRWETKNGAAVPDTDTNKNKYEADGKLHVCPYAGTDIRVTYIGENNKFGDVKAGTCVLVGDGERFKFKFTRTDDDNIVYLYEGDGRVFNNGAGPSFIHGTVKATAANGPTGGVKTGVWEAVRIGGVHGDPGTGEPPIVNTTDGTTHPTPSEK